ncbi:hypothetical protein HanIR_Chr09g0403721 [Helianthus annuus]|nr:hypothetical protein HanIR_Chr09g0403721 [Helianthus annuus]
MTAKFIGTDAKTSPVPQQSNDKAVSKNDNIKLKPASDGVTMAVLHRPRILNPK